MESPRNYMEAIVFEAVENAMKSAGGCQCDACKADAAAIALNNLPPKYVAHRDLYAKLDTMRQQFTVDVIAQVTRAVAIVAVSPRHFNAE